MKKFITTVFLLFFAGCVLFAQDIESLMQTGNENFQNKRFENAIENYQSILKQGFVSPELYYNLGNSYFRIGELGKAILYYEKSLKLSPGNEDAAYNLRIARARTVDKIQEIPDIFIVKWWNLLLTSFSASGWQIIVIIFYLLLLICIGLYFVAKNLQLQKLSFLFGFLNLTGLIFSVIFLVSSLSREHSNDYGILLQSVYSAKISPDNQSNDAFVIHEGIKFKIEDKVNNWVKIRLSDGKIGWLPENTFEVI